MTEQTSFDVIIIGGSYAGLSAAMALGRSLRKTLVIDSGNPCNRQTPHSHNFLTQDGSTPSEISTLAKQQVRQYETVQFFNGLAVSGTKTGNGFEIGTQAGDIFTGKKLIVATGIQDKLPDINGFADCWGISVIHCPYCHGYEYRNRKTGILANADVAFHLASLVNNLTKDLTILTNGEAIFPDEQRSRLEKHHIRIVEAELAQLVHENGHLQQVVFTDGTTLPFDAVYARVPFVQHSGIPAMLGCELTGQGYIKVDSLQQTTVPGVFACGDNSSMMRSVANAVSAGNFAGAVVNRELTEEAF